VASTPPAAAARVVYINAREVAEVCGMTVHHLHTQHRPAHWGVPREWRFNGRDVLYNLSVIPELADQLEQDGVAKAPLRLLAWWFNRTAGEVVGATSPSRPVAEPWYKKGSFE
jgi:hypothetical protein